MYFKVLGQCSKCQSKGKKIALKRIFNHVNDISSLKNGVEYFICKTPACEVVYFSIKNEFLTTQLNKEVGYKNSSSKEASVCYCYNIKKYEINANTIEQIQTKMSETPCACESRNVYASCCQKEIKKLLNNL